MPKEKNIFVLTDADMRTADGYSWELGTWRRQPYPEENAERWSLGAPFWYRCHTHPLVAVFMHAIHGRLDTATMRLFRGRGDGARICDRGLRMGFTRMVLDDELEVPVASFVNHVAFGILCALEVVRASGFRRWAADWLSGEDRRFKSAAPWKWFGKELPSAIDHNISWNSALAAKHATAYGLRDVRLVIADFKRPDPADLSATELRSLWVRVSAARTAEDAARAKRLDLPALAEKAMSYH